MIDQITFTKEWIASVRAKNKKADPELIEKATKALYLLECLSKTDLVLAKLHNRYCSRECC